MRALPILALVVLAAGCPKKEDTTTPPTPPTLTREDRLQVARLEAQREAGVARLVELSRDKLAPRRTLAIRALGRVGSPDAIRALRSALTGPDAVTAAAALGLAGATGVLEPADAAAITGELAKVSVTGADRATVIEAIGRIADASALGPLSSALGNDEVAVAAAAGVGLGRLGRAKIGLDDTAELALIGRTKDDDAGVRFAATYALARGFVDPASAPPAATDPVVRALRDRLGDSDAVIRATAAAGLGARRAVPVTTPPLLDKLEDTDWRVAVELVRVLGGASGTPETKKALVAYLARVQSEWATGRYAPPFAHVLLEGLRQLPERANDPKTRGFLVAIARSYADDPPARRPAQLQLASAWSSCLALAALARPLATTPPGDALNDPEVALSQLATCGAGLVPDHEVQKLTLDVIAARGGSDAIRRLTKLTDHGDVRIAAHAAELLPELWEKATAADRTAIGEALTRAVQRPEAGVAGGAAEAAGPLLAAQGKAGPLAPLADAIVVRLQSATGDAELATALLGAIGAAKLDALPACQAMRTDPSSPLRAAARECVKQLVGEDPGPAVPSAAPATPPVDPLASLSGPKRWKLTTTQGDITIALAGELAPWHVAAIQELTHEGFYDGTLFHRVVPDFVVQGGDPSGSGWGGPGFTLPAEPGSRIDSPAPEYVPGAIGVADAGKDTGGSQWFAMHGRAPHLDGRYTWIGTIVEGADVADRLQIGDRIVRARVE
ncbi:MAG TPA: peptidylprolyl isomerase [Kofleriaceae bacterium]|nr:peptidylprolyl isomerase [Kofleriaceae bacterium]